MLDTVTLWSYYTLLGQDTTSAATWSETQREFQRLWFLWETDPTWASEVTGPGMMDLRQPGERVGDPLVGLRETEEEVNS